MTTMNKSSQRDIATSATALMFVAIGLSGIMMFFHFFDDYVKEMHEWLGLVFVAAVFLHVFVHMKSLKNYFSKPLFQGFSVITLAAVFAFVVSIEEGPNPKRILINSVLNAPLESSVKVLGSEYLYVKDKLANNGIKIEAMKSINDIAKSNKISPFELVKMISLK